MLLELNGVDVGGASNDDVYDLVMSIAAGQPSVEEIATGLRRIVT